MSREYISIRAFNLAALLAVLGVVTLLAVKGVLSRDVVSGIMTGLALSLRQLMEVRIGDSVVTAEQKSTVASVAKLPGAPIAGLVAFVIGGGLAGLWGCGPVDPCTPASSRCLGAVAQICQSNGRWAAMMDCDVVASQSGGEWTCQELAVSEADGGTSSGHTCLPAPVDGGSHE